MSFQTLAGTMRNMWGVVKFIDQNARLIKLANEEDWQWIPMDSITAVRSC
ncbi:hypothetical protein [Brevibacillus sp. HD3.3A]|nr:hypothetical protein [Brevibacillus sp. HD3.3A]UED70716.1 YolD-like family protein [Brevibacillus sp. HD3.3A]